MPNQKLVSEIEKTGFVLENRIAQLLKAAGWVVISNRYYVDDTEDSVREIDLVAYRVSRVVHFAVYTTLIVSCKKSDTNIWALLAREIDRKNPNYDWSPLHAWANDKVIAYQLSTNGCAERFHPQVASLGVKTALENPEVEVFAFQEMNKSSGAPQNDKSIFAAVTSLMKAQAYELGSLPQRKKTPCVYQFNLLSIVDTDLVRLMFDGGKIKAIDVSSEHYIARYIVNKRETFSRIRFIQANSFEHVLSDYGQLHLANCQWLQQESEAFYNGVVEDHGRTSVLIKEFRKKTGWVLSWRLEQLMKRTLDSSDLDLSWNNAQKVLEVTGSYGGSDGVDALNKDKNAVNSVANVLKELYRYTGKFEFVDNTIPF